MALQTRQWGRWRARLLLGHIYKREAWLHGDDTSAPRGRFNASTRPRPARHAATATGRELERGWERTCTVLLSIRARATERAKDFAGADTEAGRIS
jgi:hypothetical protein